MVDVTQLKHRIQEISGTNEVTIVGVAGGSCSGKSFISNILAREVEGIILAMDDYYRGIESTQDGNFDEPHALDLQLLKRHIAALKDGKSITKPIYDFKTHARSGYETFEPATVIIVEGLFALHNVISNEIDVKIFVQADPDIRLERRIQRDTTERGRTKEDVEEQFRDSVQPMHEKYVEPQKTNADHITVNN